MSTSSLSAKVVVTTTSTYRRQSGAYVAPLVDPVRISRKWEFDSGQGADHAEIHWHDQRTLGATSSELIDLKGSIPGMTHAFGFDMGFDLIRYFSVVIVTNDQSPFVLYVGYDAGGVEEWTAWLYTSPSATGVVAVKVRSGTVAQGGGLIVTAPDATGYVVSNINRNLYIGNPNAFSVTYDIAVIGEGDSLLADPF